MKKKCDYYEHDLKQAFLNNVSPEPNTGCWLWLGGILKRGGYGAFNHRPSKTWMVRAHRMSWKLYRNPNITQDDHILHKCDNPLCVNPDHLFVGNQALNMEDKSYKGRQNQGKNHGSFKHGRYIGDKQNPKYHQNDIHLEGFYNGY